ncbi:GntR family transcriptional regulator [Sinomonas mesophila]|uniref:GntR family transcriptional regulator n=1 Tax=Sinomonas mesophila TaxID=1531955 RepID=UPI000987A8C1|nr:GntR family transcriptional regulator [Sinomonas mesophila]
MVGLEKRSLREQALAALRRAITSGELAPGRHLVETELSEMLGISRGTLREALRQIQQEGLATVGPRRRLSVRKLDAKEIRDIFAVRAALESLATRTLVNQANRARPVGELREALEVMEAAAERPLEDRVEADLGFHRLLCRLSGNETLLHQWEALEGSVRMSIVFSGIDPTSGNLSVARHRDIVDAIESGDVGAALQSIIRHLDGVATDLTGED